MAILNWYTPDTNDIAFMLEFDEQYVESEFTELVYGLIENAQGYALRQDRKLNESSRMYQETLDRYQGRNDSLRAENNVIQEQLDIALQELADAKLDKTIPIHTLDLKNGTSTWHDELNNMGDKAYDKTNV